MANLEELRSVVLDNLERRVADSKLQAANADRWINHVVRKIFCTRHNWDAMEATYSINTVQGQDIYAFPSPDTKDVKQVALRTGSGAPYLPLREESEDQVDEDHPTPGVTGIPMAWARTGAAIRLRPTPSVSSMRIRARVWDYPAKLVDPSATNYWTNQHDDIIETLATALGYRWLGDFERYNALWTLGMKELGDRVEDDAKRLRPSRQTVAPGTRAGRANSSSGPRLGESGMYRQYVVP